MRVEKGLKIILISSAFISFSISNYRRAVKSIDLVDSSQTNCGTFVLMFRLCARVHCPRVYCSRVHCPRANCPLANCPRVHCPQANCPRVHCPRVHCPWANGPRANCPRVHCPRANCPLANCPQVHCPRANCPVPPGLLTCIIRNLQNSVIRYHEKVTTSTQAGTMYVTCINVIYI